MRLIRALLFMAILGLVMLTQTGCILFVAGAAAGAPSMIVFAAARAISC